MGLPLDPAPDIVAAVAAYLQSAMRASLGATDSSPQVWADYAEPCPYPYAVVTEGPETYTQQGEDHASTGYWLSDIANGSLQVAFYAKGKAQARSLGREAVRVLADPDRLAPADGRVLTVYAVSASSAALDVEGAGVPTVFLRIVTFNYTQQFLV